ncbi:hypothetical protein GW933_04015 [Candidatus Falkowbacteria bacterium]|uniref:Uncharacterized protein n=1 Tax=Candidatus Buchananbacteria bacterium CG10_big_fil_rev_8_21_14_0_10_33_19 TaxID=1974525 RepID=A0A2H0W592_9BACT|nr:hypothetical protein [Candidatus Falkowbacteria bacterium]PIS06494.1 MAG: hypothetical protein COT80_00980 [Candidatus Buchananbacteria bacterium CG10_big_fil_rev_8_21_14_0_10_33_19]
MRWQERQNKVEAAVYDVMDELSDILSIKVPYYPEVWWLGRSIDTNKLCLSGYLQDELEIRNFAGISYYIISKKMVIIGRCTTRHSILEESSHAFHFITSDISYKNRSQKDCMCLGALVELFGFLGARLVGSDLENPYEAFPDLSKLTKQSQKEVRQKLIEKFGDNFDIDDFFVHQQGYGLADRIYFEYLSGNVSASRLRRLFLAKMSSVDGAINCFVRLKNEFWPHDLSQAM